MTNCIFTTVDRNYENYARACFNSLEENYPDHPIVLVFYEDLSEEFKEFVEKKNNFKLELINYDLCFGEEFNLGPVGNKIVYVRYLLWTDWFEDYDDVLHLDVDTLVLGNLDGLFGRTQFTMFDNNEILHGVDIIERSDGAQQALNSLLPNANYNVFDPPSFGNAGIFVIPKNIRNYDHVKSHYKQLLEITTTIPNVLIYADQSAINLWMRENNIPVSREIEYNFQPHFFNYEENTYTLEDVKILHFAAKKADTIQFSLWWRMKNLGTDFYMLYKKYLEMK